MVLSESVGNFAVLHSFFCGLGFGFSMAKDRLGLAEVIVAELITSILSSRIGVNELQNICRLLGHVLKE